MLDQNEVFITGTLADVPSVDVVGAKKTPKATFKIHQKSKFNYEGQIKEVDNYHRCVAWGHLAQAVGQAPVGGRIEIRGELTHRSWEQNGEKKYMTEVKSTNVFLPQKTEEQTSAAQPQPTPPPDPNVDDEIPF